MSTEGEFMFKKACDISACSIVITDADANIIYANDACCELTGYSREEVIGQNPRMFKSGEQSPEVYQEMWDTLLSGQPWRGEFANKKKDGSLYWERIVIVPHDEDGKRYYIGVKKDITVEKRLERKVESLDVLLKRITG